MSKKTNIHFTQIITILWLKFLVFSVGFSQPGIELAVGGSNFIGATVNASYTFKLDSLTKHKIGCAFGIGTNLIYKPGAIALIQGSVRYQRHKWCIGIETTMMMDSPVTKQYFDGPMSDLIVLPHVAYTGRFFKSMYWRPTLGWFLGYSRGVASPFSNNKLKFHGGNFPFIGVAFGKPL